MEQSEDDAVKIQESDVFKDIMRELEEEAAPLCGMQSKVESERGVVPEPIDLNQEAKEEIDSDPVYVENEKEAAPLCGMQSKVGREMGVVPEPIDLNQEPKEEISVDGTDVEMEQREDDAVKIQELDEKKTSLRETEEEATALCGMQSKFKELGSTFCKQQRKRPIPVQFMLENLVGSRWTKLKIVSMDTTNRPDIGTVIQCTGSGGRDLSGNKRTNKDQYFDQQFVKFSQALRVVGSNKDKQSSYAPEKDVLYDVVYRIEKWRKVGIQV